MSQANIPATDKVGARTLINTNGLLSTLKYPNYFYQYATGIKTGTRARLGIVWCLRQQKGDLEVIGVVRIARQRTTDITIQKICWLMLLIIIRL